MLNTLAQKPRFDADAAEAFAGRAMEIVNTGAAAVMMSLGHRLGLFDQMDAQPAATSTAIAARAGLSERYVREWLAVMVTARIVTFDPATGTYLLPAEHAAALTRNGALGNFALYAQHVALLGAVEARLLRAFHDGGGMSYGDYPCFHQIMAEDSGQSVTAPLFEVVLPLVPGIIPRLEAGIDVLDAGCGRGTALLAMARRFPRSRFVGYDLAADAIAYAHDQAALAGIGNLHYEQRDLTGFDADQGFDLITSFDAVHDQKDPADFIRRLHRALKPGGVYLMQDIGGSAHLENNLEFPMASLLYAMSCAHCMPISLGQGGAGLGTMWGWETARQMLEQAGFAGIARHVLPHDPVNVWFVSEKK